MKSLRVIFFGTSAFAARILFSLLQEEVEIVAVITRPDRPKGRSLQLLPSPVKEEALKLNVPIYQPEKASTPEFAEVLTQLKPDLFIVAAYGEIMRQNILGIPRLGCINIHTSLLPKYRGAAPIHRALLAGEKETGITIIEMNPQMDAGDMLAREKITIPSDMTFAELEDALCSLACRMLADLLPSLQQGTVKKIVQDHAQATLAPKITPEDEQIHWDKPAASIHNQVRALSPTPGAWCWVTIGQEKKRLKVKRSQTAALTGAPGTTLQYGKEGWVVACGTGALKLLEVQLEGKKNLPVQEFIRGLPQIPQLF